MSEDEIIAMMLQLDKLKAALQEIAEYNAACRSGYVDEWEEAAAFIACRRIAGEVLQALQEATND